MNGGAVFVAEAKHGQTRAPVLEPFVRRGFVAEVITEAELPIRFGFDTLPAPVGVEFTG